MNSEKVTTTHRVRVVTAASLFDGHDAAINVMRRLIQSMGCEVIHLGHNRSVADVVQAAIEEDAQAVAISSYQGGHMEYFRYMVQLLREQGAGHVKVYGGGGGVIVPEEIRQLHADGVTRIYHPEDGRRLGLVGMIADLVRGADYDVTEHGQQDAEALLAGVKAGDKGALGPADHPGRARGGVPWGPGAVSARGAQLRRRARRSSASPAPAARASRRSPMSSCAAPGGTTPIAPSPCSPSTPRANAPAARSWATASA
jgi:methylmalonyl-CoA mutase cobalamin-binding domain/chain